MPKTLATSRTDTSALAPKASPTFTGTVVIPTPFTLGAVSVLPTGTELNFVDGVTSAIQTQLDSKATGTIPVKATGAEINTGTDDAKFATAKALVDANILSKAWTSFTPSWSNITVGSGTSVGYYTRIGKTIIGYIYFAMAANSSVTSNIGVNFPVSSVTVFGSSTLLKTGEISAVHSGTVYQGAVRWYTTSTMLCDVFQSAGTYVTSTIMTPTVPFTWATGDELFIKFTYQAA